MGWSSNVLKIQIETNLYDRQIQITIPNMANSIGA